MHYLIQTFKKTLFKNLTYCLKNEGQTVYNIYKNVMCKITFVYTHMYIE